MRIITGPVVGAVGTDSARVLIEPDGDGVFEATACAPGHVVKSVGQRPPGRATVVFVFSGLRPGSRYEVTFGDLDARRATFRTVAADAPSLRALCLSCNDVAHAGSKAAWAQALRRVDQDDVDVVLHVGDQVYADDVFNSSVAVLRGLGAARVAEAEAWVLERYRALYRDTWNQPLTRALLGRTSNLCMWDDHEVVDDWGDRKFPDPAAAEHRVATIAWRVFREYQKPLWSDEPLAAPLRSEEYWHRMGPFALCLLDNRGGRALDPAANPPYLGAKQWGSLHSWFDAGGVLDQARLANVIVCTPVPLAFIGCKFIDTHVWKEDDVRGHWSCGRHAQEQQRLFALLAAWKARSPERTLLLASGDVHVSARFEVDEYSDPEHRRPLCQELVASPIATSTPGKLSSYVYEAFVGQPAEPWTLDGRFRWRLAQGFVHEPSFGTIHFARNLAHPDQPAVVTLGIVTGGAP